MEFLTLLIVFGLLQWWGSGSPLQRDQWYQRWELLVANSVSSPPFRLLVCVAVPCLLVLLAQLLVDSFLFGMLLIVLYVGVLLYSLGRGDFSTSVQNYLESWNHGDFEAAYNKATAIGDFRESELITDHRSLHDSVRVAVMYEAFERWFAVVFWFVALGPVACIAYRLCYLTSRADALANDSGESQEYQRLALRVIYYLDWLPARLLVLSFTLTGNFVNCFNRCWQLMFDNIEIPELINECATAAISGFHESDEHPTDKERFIKYASAQMLALQSLLSRSVICWLAIFAVMQFV